MHSGPESGEYQRSTPIPDAEAKTGGLIDIAILVRGAVEQVIEKSLSGLILPIEPMKWRMRSERDERTLSAGRLAAMGFGVHDRIPERCRSLVAGLL
jgi:hypothetical protein